jgi:hypothetical protein
LARACGNSQLSSEDPSARSLHDGRLLTLDDRVEFFNLVLGTKPADDQKRDLVVFLRAL